MTRKYPDIGPIKFYFDEFVPLDTAVCSPQAYAMVNDLYNRAIKLQELLDAIATYELHMSAAAYDKLIEVTEMIEEETGMKGEE